jgi:hypothetical protein
MEDVAMIEPEAVPPTPSPRRRRLAVLAGVTALAVVAGGIAIAGGGGHSEPKLALMAGNGAGGGAETMAARNGSPEPALAPAQGAAADSKAAVYPYGGWGMKFEVEGQLPDLPDHAAAWRINGPELDRAAVTRIAEALEMQGTPVQRDGGWFVEAGEWTLSAYGGDAFASINLYRSHPDRRDAPPAGTAISRAEAEERVRNLLDRMGAPAASWTFEITETEIGPVWGCAAPAPGIIPEDMTKLEAEKLLQVEQQSATANSPSTASAAPTPAGKPAPDGSVGSCPPPPPPVKGFNVALYPMLDGRRADWAAWNLTLRSDGGIEGLYGSWVTFERVGNYKLRGVDAALKELESPAVAYATDLPATTVEPATPPPAQTSAGAVEGSGNTGSAPSRMPLTDDGATSPAPDIAPCPPIPVRDGKAVSSPLIACAPLEPQVVKITGVELGLVQASVFEDGKVRWALVPAYRFTGHFDNGTPWSTSVIALHPDAIAPPPAFPVTDDIRSGGGGGSTGTGVGKAIPPTPPAAEPAPAKK